MRIRVRDVRESRRGYPRDLRGGEGFEALAHDDYAEAAERFAMVDGYTRFIAATTPCAPSCGACEALS